jgi:hypothetical protein
LFAAANNDTRIWLFTSGLSPEGATLLALPTLLALDAPTSLLKRSSPWSPGPPTVGPLLADFNDENAGGRKFVIGVVFEVLLGLLLIFKLMAIPIVRTNRVISSKIFQNYEIFFTNSSNLWWLDVD